MVIDLAWTKDCNKNSFIYKSEWFGDTDSGLT